MKQQAEQQDQYYNFNTHGNQHKRGDFVYLKVTTKKKGVSPKLAPKWTGPFVVVSRFGIVYEVLVPPTISKIYHFDLLDL